MKAVKISGEASEFLSVELKNILLCIPKGDEYKWSILHLEAIGYIGISLPAFEAEIQNSENGLVIEWLELLEISKQLNQIIEIILIASKDFSKLKRYSVDVDMYNACDYTIELVDSSYWIIHTVDNQNLNSFEILKGVENFESTENLY